MQVIKAVIKSEELPNVQKYRALHMLKELLKINDKSFRDYCDQNIMNRFKELALSNGRENVLLAYNKKSDQRYSRKFYYLLLECFVEWHQLFGESSIFYIDVINKMKESGIHPHEKKYYPRLAIGPERSLEECRDSLEKSRLDFVSTVTNLSRQGVRDHTSELHFKRWEKQVEKLKVALKMGQCLRTDKECLEKLDAERRLFEEIKAAYTSVNDDPLTAKRFFEVLKATYLKELNEEKELPDFESPLNKLTKNNYNFIFVPTSPNIEKMNHSFDSSDGEAHSHSAPPKILPSIRSFSEIPVPGPVSVQEFTAVQREAISLNHNRLLNAINNTHLNLNHVSPRKFTTNMSSQKSVQKI